MDDLAYKRLFSRRRMVRDLLSGFAARDWSAELDLGSLTPLSASYVTDDLRQRHGDLVWRLRFKDERWLYVVRLLELQSAVDRSMAVRMLTYTALLYQKLIADGLLRERSVLPVVIYNGRRPWTVLVDVAELIASGSGASLERYQPSQRCFLLDEGHVGGADRPSAYGTPEYFAAMVLGHLATTRLQQEHQADRITFSLVDPWPGERICARGRYTEGDEGPERRAGILVGPEFGTVARQELVRGAREAAEAGFDVLVACGFNFEPHATEFSKLGALRVLKARMNANLRMADDLANTGKGNLFVIFGEPDIEVLPVVGEDPETGRIQVKIHGVDVFHPSTGEVRSDGADGIACWFIDTDYNDESFFVRQAYFLGANDPYKALRTTLKAEIDTDARASLHSDTSQPFERPKSGRIAVKMINHLGHEVMKTFGV